MIEQLAAFHFIRPLWLIMILVAVAVWYVVRPRRAATQEITADIAPHLADALKVGDHRARRTYPVDWAVVFVVLMILAAAGPTWSRMPNPLTAETAPLVVALKVTPTMETPDLAPTRLERAKFKILDLIAARAGARTALVAYAGTAHRVSPLTEDPNILRPLIESLTPQVMPQEGQNATAALELSAGILAEAETPGAILFVLDDLAPADIGAFAQETPTPRPPVVFLVALPEDTPLPQLDRIANATIVRLSSDDSDIAQIERRLRSAQRAALLADDRLAWDDRGWLLIWPAAVLALLWFRRGWTMRWALALLAFGLGQAPSQTRAEGWVDWFLTPDQQGRWAYEQKDYTRAGELFNDPMWLGYAKMKDGQYADAAEIFARLDTAAAAFAEGLSRIRNREYRPAIAAFETTLERDPDYPGAQQNLEITKAALDYVETAREQSDTGEEAGLGADDVVFDNDAQRGAETQIEAAQEDGAGLMTADQWIESIDTDMGDFLRSRFLLDTTRGEP